MELVPLRKRPQRFPLTHPPCEDAGRRRPSVNQELGTGALILDFSASRTGKSASVVHKPTSVLYSVLGAQTG